MKNSQIEQWEITLDTRRKRREKKRKPRMKKSGASVKKLQRLIINKKCVRSRLSTKSG